MAAIGCALIFKV